MTVLLKAGDLTPGELIDLIGGAEIPADAERPLRIWAEAPDAWALDFWRGLDGHLLWCAAHRGARNLKTLDCLSTAWAGRIFAPSGELRWRIIRGLGSNCCRTVFLGSQDWLPGKLQDRSDILRTLVPHLDRYFLWGQCTDASPDEWIELRIPHRFRYPLVTRSRGVRLVVELWRDPAGETHFARLCDLEPYQEAGDAQE
ncbi:MAG: hypothetical protein GXY83_27740 [Rhodopirellula sp.]|nr:hypothetical protein [Rhodopirellula sp.]